VSFVRLAEIPLNKTETDISYEYSTNIIWWYVTGSGLRSMPLIFFTHLYFWNPRPNLLYQSQATFSPSITFTYAILTPLSHSLIEMYIGIICASLPILKPFMKYHFPRVFAVADQPRPEQVYVSPAPSRPTDLSRSWATTQTESDASESGLRLKTGTGTQMTMSSTREMYNGIRPGSDDPRLESR